MIELLAPIAVIFLIPFVRQTVLNFWDHRRIRAHLEATGGKDIEISSSPFQSSYADRNRDGVYLVRYQDRDGATQTVYCRNSMSEGIVVSENSDEPLAMDLKKRPPRKR